MTTYWTIAVWNDDGRFHVNLDLGLYSTRELAQAKVDELNAAYVRKINYEARESYQIRLVQWERTEAANEILRAAGHQTITNWKPVEPQEKQQVKGYESYCVWDEIEVMA